MQSTDGIFLKKSTYDNSMWTAHCDYVRKLLPPKTYSPAMQTMLDDTLWNLERQEFNCLRPKSSAQNHVGLERYAPERWIYDHPHVKPCNILPIKLAAVPVAFPQNWTPIAQPRPIVGESTGSSAKTPSYTRLVGRLYQWQYLYGLAPPKDSWIWKAYSGNLGYEGGSIYLQNCLNNSMHYNDTVNSKILLSLTPNEFMMHATKHLGKR